MSDFTYGEQFLCCDEFIYGNNLLKLYTNLSVGLFDKAAKNVLQKIKGKYGIIYDDFDYDKTIIDKWKKYSLTKIFIQSIRKKTITMDDKIDFHNVMSTSKFTPESYLHKSEITDKESLYFVKDKGSVRGMGVNICDYNTLQKMDTSRCVIQKNINNPDLYNGKRYRIRQLILVYNKSVYIHKNSYFILSNSTYDKNHTDLRDKHIIIGKGLKNIDSIQYEFSNKLNDFDLIYNNTIIAIKDFNKYYSKEINNICGNEYTILGIDLIVDSDKNVQIIEINHRPAYRLHHHNLALSDRCQRVFIEDTLLLLTTNDITQTNFDKI